tara:strand:- start:117 stop:641 length:525 start_codon:yes stop_codon:yes gene_type:complete
VTGIIADNHIRNFRYLGMQIKLIAIGKTDNKAIISLIEEYSKRLNFYIKFEFEVIPDLKNTKSLSEILQKEKEGELILKKIGASDDLILLDERGKSYSSMDFSEFLQKKMNSGLKQLIFVIGGPYGFSDEVYSRSNGKLSISKMTFSHQMIRPFFIEQLYRGFTILRNEPYHHE